MLPPVELIEFMKESRIQPIERRIFTVALIVLTGFVASAFGHHFFGLILHWPYPANTLLFDPTRAGTDFFDTLQAMGKKDFYSEGVVYFPGSLIFGLPFTLLDQSTAYFVFSALVLMVTATFVFCSFMQLRISPVINSLLTIILVFLNYPMLLCLDRGNFEGLSFVCLIGFAWFARRKMVWVAATFLGFAAATKLYPIVFGAILLRRRNWRQFLFAGVLAGLLNLIPALFLPGGLIANFSRLLVNQRVFNIEIGMTYGSVPFGLSIFSWVKIGIYLFTDGMMPSYLFTLYSPLCAAATLYCFYFAVRRIDKVWEILFFAFAPWLVFPQISYAYKLIWLIVPLCLMFEDEGLSSIDLWLFGLLMIPKTLIPLGLADTSFAVIIDPILIIALAVRIYLRNRRSVTGLHPNSVAASGS